MFPRYTSSYTRSLESTNSICDPNSDICDIYGIIKYIWIDVGKEERKLRRNAIGH